MRRFVFRAEVALALRRRQEDEAKRALAAAEGRLRTAQRAHFAATDALASTLKRASEADGKAGSVTVGVWYRNWIVRQKQDVALAAQAVARCQADADLARSHLMMARRKRKSLERFRERALAAHVRAEHVEEQKALDALGTMRFAMAKQGGSQ
ncbi:MAG: flagellar FliJ family protein [Acidobacteria bacterium]|nr:flagellar FliJ family protein [Acidobacteriota bacterium]